MAAIKNQNPVPRVFETLLGKPRSHERAQVDVTVAPKSKMRLGAWAGATWISWQLAITLISGGALGTELTLRLRTHDTLSCTRWEKQR